MALKDLASEFVMTVYFNGLGSTREQALRYTDEIITLKDGVEHYRAVAKDPVHHTIYNVLPAEDFDDTDIVYISGGHVHREVRPRWPKLWIEWPDDLTGCIVHKPHFLRFYHMGGPTQMSKCLGDVRRALEWKSEDPRRRVVIYGTSRGAGLALLTAAALGEEEQEQVDLVVAEGPPDSIPNIASYRHGGSLLAWLASKISWHTAPIDVSFPQSIPVVIGSGTEDWACPLQGQQRLVDKMRREGHTNVTHVIAEGAHHDGIWQNDEWRRAVHQAHAQLLREVGKEEED